MVGFAGDEEGHPEALEQPPPVAARARFQEPRVDHPGVTRHADNLRRIPPLVFVPGAQSVDLGVLAGHF